MSLHVAQTNGQTKRQDLNILRVCVQHNKRAYNKSQRGELCPSLSTLRTRLAVFSLHLQISRVTNCRDANLDLHVSFHTFELTVLVLVIPSMRREHGRPHLRSWRSSWRPEVAAAILCSIAGCNSGANLEPQLSSSTLPLFANANQSGGRIDLLRFALEADTSGRLRSMLSPAHKRALCADKEGADYDRQAQTRMKSNVAMRAIATLLRTGGIGIRVTDSLVRHVRAVGEKS